MSGEKINSNLETKVNSNLETKVNTKQNLVNKLIEYINSISSTLDDKIKNDFIKVLENISLDDLTGYIEINLDGGNFTKDSIIDFINVNEKLLNSKTEKLAINNFDLDETKKIEKKENELEKKESYNEKIGKYLNDNNINKLKSLTKFSDFINNIENAKNTRDKIDLKKLEIEKNKDNISNRDNLETERKKLEEKEQKLIQEIDKFLKKNKKEFFDAIAATGDKELYESTYQALSNLSPDIKETLFDISPVIYKVEIVTDTKKDIDIISQFPDAKDGEITKRGDIVSFGDKTIDLRDKKAYITGENGYKLETSISLPDTLDLKAEYLARKLEIKETINTDKKILELLGNKKKIKKDIEDLEKQKKGGLGEDTGVNIAINLLQKELEQIQAKLAGAVPNYRENQDDLLTLFLENSIKENEEKLAKLEEKYRKEISELYEKSADKVKENDETTRQTVLLLDSIGFTLIPKHITDDIIATINKNPEHYGFDSRIDLKNGNFGGPNTIPTKERFIKKFNKMISGKEGEPITSDDINNILVKKIEKDKDSQEERNKDLLAKFSTYNIMSDLGTWDREKLESNLTIKEKQETPKETK